jgi:hypothetical protein
LGQFETVPLYVDIPAKLKTTVEKLCDKLTAKDPSTKYTIKRFVIEAVQEKIQSFMGNGDHPKKTLVKRPSRGG